MNITNSRKRSERVIKQLIPLLNHADKQAMNDTLDILRHLDDCLIRVTPETNTADDISTFNDFVNNLNMFEYD